MVLSDTTEVVMKVFCATLLNFGAEDLRVANRGWTR